MQVNDKRIKKIKILLYHKKLRGGAGGNFVFTINYRPGYSLEYIKREVSLASKDTTDEISEKFDIYDCLSKNNIPYNEIIRTCKKIDSVEKFEDRKKYIIVPQEEEVDKVINVVLEVNKKINIKNKYKK